MKSAAFIPLLILCLTSPPLSAKGPTTRIVITAPGLPASIEITDANLLDDFFVWSGPGVRVNGHEESQGFIVDWPKGVVAERPADLPHYEVFFYVKHANRPLASQVEELGYVVSYEPDFVSGGGFVYLPGKGDGRYPLNVKSIFRGHEGDWFRASDAWNKVAFAAIGGRP